jgi:hypothetical protein
MFRRERRDRSRKSGRENNGQAFKIFIAVDYQRIGARIRPMHVMSAPSNSINFTSPQTILGFPLSHIQQQDLRVHGAPTPLNRTNVGAPPRFILLRANSTLNGVTTFALRPTRAASISLPGLSMSDPNARIPIDGGMISSFEATTIKLVTFRVIVNRNRQK